MNIITIFEGDTPVATFAAPENVYVARQLWVLLVERLQPGMTVSLTDNRSTFTTDSGQRGTPELYARLMEGAVGDEDERH